MATDTNTLRTLMLTLAYPHRASFYDDWREAFLASRQFNTTVLNILNLQPLELSRKLDDYDAIIVMHSCNNDTLHYLAPLCQVLGNRRRGKLLCFVGNEYNSPYVSMSERVRLFKTARADMVATQLLVEAGRFLYSGTGAQIISVPHALNPGVFRPGVPDDKRRLDIGVKGYRYPPYLGDDERNRLMLALSKMASSYGLSVDISQDRRLGRRQWAEFLSDCRGTISTETGSWYLDPTDTLIHQIYDYLREKRTGIVIKDRSVLRRAARRLPTPIKAMLWAVLKRGPVKFEVLDDFETSFDELYQKFFKTATRAPIYGKAISSRHFDAIGTKTCQVMLRGRFNDILSADLHYIAIDSDFANLDEAVRRFMEPCERQRITENAYEFAMSAHTYAHRAEAVRRALESL
jgi:spore maturation protein CgeB